MTTWQEAEEADQEAAERARVHEWALEHPNPLTAALRRAEAAEEELRRLHERHDGLTIDLTPPEGPGHRVRCVIRQHDKTLFDGVETTPLRRDGGEPT